MENPIKMDDLGVPLFQETTIIMENAWKRKCHLKIGGLSRPKLDESWGLWGDSSGAHQLCSRV